ncbi:MAG: efflux RND transporter periplasmic adaptor subunit [Chthonomonadales bacterium]
MAIEARSVLADGKSGCPARRGVLWVLLCLCALLGCGRRAPGTAAAAPDGAASSAAVAVSVAKARIGTISKSVDVDGSLAALHDVVLGPRQAGKVAKVFFHAGDRVAAGQVVAQMDTVDLLSQLRQAQAGLQAAITRQQQAVAQLEQARNQLEQARTNLHWTDATTATALKVAQSQLAIAQERLSETREGARPQERRQAEDQVAAARANFIKARADLERAINLYQQQAISKSQLDQAQAAADAAQAQYSSAQQSLSLVREGARAQDIRQAELAVQQARDGLAKAKADRTTVQLRQQDVLTAQEGVKAAEAGLEASRAGVEQARATLHLAQEALKNAFIKTPIGGIVADRFAEPGQQLGAGAPIVRVVAPHSIYFQAQLSESQYRDVRLGQVATITVDAFPNERFRGVVRRIWPVASQARIFTVRVELDDRAKLRPQMFAHGSILVATHRGATLVPKDAVVFDVERHEAHLFTVRGQHAHQVQVDTGFVTPSDVEILRPIRPGDVVVVAGQNTLQDGDLVTIR